MKLAFTLLLLLLSFHTFSANTVEITNLNNTNTLTLQNNDEQKDAGLYSLFIDIAQELRTEASSGRLSISSSISDEMKDAMRKLAESKCSEKFNANVKCIYKRNKKGKEIPSIIGVSGMPGNTFKNAAENNKKDLYIKITVYIKNDGKQIQVGKKKSRIKIVE